MAGGGYQSTLLSMILRIVSRVVQTDRLIAMYLATRTIMVEIYHDGLSSFATLQAQLMSGKMKTQIVLSTEKKAYALYKEGLPQLFRSAERVENLAGSSQFNQCSTVEAFQYLKEQLLR